LRDFRISLILIVRQFLDSVFKNFRNKIVIKILSDLLWICSRVFYLDALKYITEFKFNMNIVFKIFDVSGIVLKPLKIEFVFFFMFFVNLIFLNIFVNVINTDFNFLN
jgi:hypothetical protein